MRHNVYGKKLGRTKNERNSLFRNLVHSLFLEEKIETTQAKASAIKGLIDRVISQAQTPTTRRLVSQFLTNKKAEAKLLNDLLPRLKSRKSGFTSVIKTGRRQGDGSMMVQVKLLLDEVVKAPAVKEDKKASGKKVEAKKDQEEKIETVKAKEVKAPKVVAEKKESK